MSLFRRKATSKLPKGERFYITVHQSWVSVTRDGQTPSMSIEKGADFNAVRVAGKIAKMLNEGRLK